MQQGLRQQGLRQQDASSLPPCGVRREGWQSVRYAHSTGWVQEIPVWPGGRLVLCDLTIRDGYQEVHPFHEGLYVCLILEGTLRLSGMAATPTATCPCPEPLSSASEKVAEEARVQIDVTRGEGGAFRAPMVGSPHALNVGYFPGRLRCVVLHIEDERQQSDNILQRFAEWDLHSPPWPAQPRRWRPGSGLRQQLAECLAQRLDGAEHTRETCCLLEWQGLGLQLLGGALRRRHARQCHAGQVSEDRVARDRGADGRALNANRREKRAHERLTPGYPETSSSTCRHLEAVRQRLKMAPERQHALPELARLACMSASSLRQKFRETYGCSLSQYQRECRMQRARQALLQGMSVQQVAHRVGYAHACNFATAYRRHFGLSPQAVRARPQRAD